MEAERKCDRCGEKEAFVYQPHTGRFLCRECFLEDVVMRIKNTIVRYRMITAADKVLLALSGGKDSFLLLDALTRIHPTEKLIGLMVVEGVPGYSREDEIRRMKKYCRERGVKLFVARFKDVVGLSLAEIIEKTREKELDISPCTFCGGIRRKIINAVARHLGATRVATAHTLDDEVQTAVINFLRGDPDRLVRQHPAAPRLSEAFVQRVKPLREVYEWEVALYCYYMGFEFQEEECPFIVTRPTMRARIRKLLLDLEAEKPGAMMRMLSMISMLSDIIARETERMPKLPLCSVCGEPTSYGRRLCRLCELLETIGVELKIDPTKIIEA